MGRFVERADRFQLSFLRACLEAAQAAVVGHPNRISQLERAALGR